MIGDRLRVIRRSAGMNMKEFAAAMGIKYTTYAGYEQGAHEPGAAFLAQTAQQWHTTVDYLLGLTESVRPPQETTVLSFDHDPAQDFLTAEEYAHLKAWRHADPRARADALRLLTENAQ